MIGTIELVHGKHPSSSGSILVVLAEVRGVSCIFKPGHAQYAFTVFFRNLEEGMRVDGFDTSEAAEATRRVLFDALGRYFARNEPPA